MDIIDLKTDIELAKKAAKEAGKLLQENRDQLNKSLASSKKDTKLLADLKAEDLIKDILDKGSEYPILAEESGKSAKDLGDVFWVIDPLDGTANYNREIPCVAFQLLW